jgi:hypothetical protein
MDPNISDERLAQVKKLIESAEKQLAEGKDPNGTFRALLELSKQDLAQLEAIRRKAKDDPK